MNLFACSSLQDYRVWEYSISGGYLCEEMSTLDCVVTFSSSREESDTFRCSFAPFSGGGQLCQELQLLAAPCFGFCRIVVLPACIFFLLFSRHHIFVFAC